MMRGSNGYFWLLILEMASLLALSTLFEFKTLIVK